MSIYLSIQKFHDKNSIYVDMFFYVSVDYEEYYYVSWLSVFSFLKKYLRYDPEACLSLMLSPVTRADYVRLLLGNEDNRLLLAGLLLLVCWLRTLYSSSR